MATANLILASSNYPKVLVSMFLPSSQSTLYEALPNTSVAVSTASVCNTSSFPRTAYLSVVKSGGTAGASNRVAIIELTAGESTVVEELTGLLLGPGDYISGFSSADGASVAIAITGAVSS